MTRVGSQRHSKKNSDCDVVEESGLLRYYSLILEYKSNNVLLKVGVTH
jgi:hypothetical protein